MEICAERNDHFGLCVNDVDVWQIDLNEFDQHINLLWEMLSTDEQEQAMRYRFGSDKRNYVVTYGTLRLLLARYLKCEPTALRYEWNGSQLDAVTCGPLNVENRHVIRCTLSYTGSIALIAVTRSQTVGVDIKKVEAIPEQAAIIGSYFSQREQMMFSQMPAQRTNRMFYSLLALKSAICKAEYDVYSTPLSEVDITVNGSISSDAFEAPMRNGNWLIQSLNLNTAHAAAVAVPSSVENIRHRMASPEQLVNVVSTVSERF